MYKLPNTKTLLPDFPQMELGSENVDHMAELLEAQLENFGVKGTVVATNPGPVITQFEIKLFKGQKASEVEKLSTDLAIALKAKSIRVLTPIPGKGTIGIEIPNDKSQTVYIKDVMENTDVSDMTLPLILGKDVVGNNRAMDLAKAPHLLIAGQTGSGKSVGVNVFINSLLTYKTPDEVKLLLIDPKVVELTPYQNVPHVIGDVITDPKKAVDALKWAVDEMERRYKLMAEYCVRSIHNYNLKFPNIPYIVIVIDELADLMMTAGKEIEDHIVRIAQKARAVGIHMILTTQRPDVKVITGLIKSNLPARIGFNVASQTDAKIIMDSIGCEKLLGNGDMFLKTSEMNVPERIHGAFISDDDTKAIVDACEEQAGEKLILNFTDDEEDVDVTAHPKFKEALELARRDGRHSASFLQRVFDLNYVTSHLMSKRIEETLSSSGSGLL